MSHTSATCVCHRAASTYCSKKIRPFMPRRRGYRSMIRPNVSPKEALVMTLRFLATGASQRSLSFSFRCAPCTVREAILETCRAIWDALNGTVLRFPKDEQEWRHVAREFERLWNFPHCCGAMDGKHVVCQCPPNSGSVFFNYKGAFSLCIFWRCAMATIAFS